MHGYSIPLLKTFKCSYYFCHMIYAYFPDLLHIMIAKYYLHPEPSPAVSAFVVVDVDTVESVTDSEAAEVLIADSVVNSSEVEVISTD